jgi:hypothetical protein
MNSYLYNSNSEMNDYLTRRNSLHYRGELETLHPLYKREFENGKECILNFLEKTVLSRARYQRLNKIYALSADKCYNNQANNYTFSEAKVCEEILIKKDPVLVSIEEFKKEMSIRILDDYEKSAENYTKTPRFSVNEFERRHRTYLNRLNFYDRYLYYFLASSLFLSR